MRTTKMVARAVRSVASAVGLVDNAAEIARAKERESKRRLLATETDLIDAMKAASREVEAVKAKIKTGELHPGAAYRPEQKYADAAGKVQQCKVARRTLRDSAPDELRVRYLRKKRELVSTTTRINLLNRQQIPDAERELVKLQEAAKLATEWKAAGSRDLAAKAQLESEARKANRAVADLEADIEGLRLELTTATERLAALESELSQIDRDILAA